MKKNNIGVLITIIILLFIFLPGAIYGTYMHYKNVALGGNPSKEFYYDGKLYFYNGDNLLGTYTCNTITCDYATNFISTDYEFETFNQNASKITMINNRYAFIKDGEKINFVDVKTGTIIVDYQAVKNYSVGISDNYYIVKNNNGLWGMLQITDNARVAVPFEYQYLGLANNLTTNNELDASKLIAYDYEGWKLINSANSTVAVVNAEIINYSNNFVITKNNQIFDYNNNQVLNGYILSEIKLLDNIVIALTTNNTYVVYSASTKSIIGTLIKETTNEYDFTIENNSLVVKANSTVVKTIALN